MVLSRGLGTRLLLWPSGPNWVMGHDPPLCHGPLYSRHGRPVLPFPTGGGGEGWLKRRKDRTIAVGAGPEVCPTQQDARRRMSKSPHHTHPTHNRPAALPWASV